MRTLGVIVALSSSLLLLQSGAFAGSGSGAFRPKSHVISRTSFLGVTPRSTYAQVQAQWGRSPNAGPRLVRTIGRSSARWGNYFAFGPTAAVAYYADRRPGRSPFRYSVDLGYSRETGVELRTARGDRAGTPVAAFRRRWPGARRYVSEPGYTWYVAPSAHRGWQLAFLFAAGQLKQAELATSGYVASCIARRCSAYPAVGSS
jgi:hypothetical protein